MGSRADDGSGSRLGVTPGALTDLLRQVAAAPYPGEGEPEPLLPGTVIGRFEIVRELGRGAFGVVYEAKDRELGRQVALKLVRPGAAAADDGKVTREAEAIARLAHPNLVTLHDVGRCDYGPYLVFELLRGKTLQERLDDGPLPVREAVHVAVEVARGLAHAHAEGVVHRDLKPANVFVTSRGQVKILDFGMAHAFGRRRLSGGTPAYMAPEQWEDDPEDERTDVFALGVMLYRMLSGAFPFPEGEGRWSAGPVTAPSLKVPGAPELSELVERMLDRTPKARPRDGAAVLEALTAIEDELRARPVDAQPGLHPVAGRVAASTSRGRLVVLFASVGLIAALSGAAWYVLRLRGDSAAGASGAVPGGPPAVQATAATPTVAVLPFADMSPGKDQEYLSDGLAEEILNVLAQIEGLRVTARTSSFSFKGKAATAAEIGQALHVDTLLEGSVRKAGNRIRVTAQLVKAADGFHLWSRTFDRDLADVFVLQDDIAKAVAEALKVTLLAGKGPAMAERRPANPEAYEQYLLGLEIRKQNDNAAGYRRAIEVFQRVLALDPAFAPAWASLSFAAYGAAVTSETAVEGDRHWATAREAAEKAITLAPDLSMGFVARANVRMTLGLDWIGAETDLERAIALNPSDVRAIWALGYSRYALRGRLEDVLTAGRRVTELDPLSPRAWYRLGVAHVHAGDFELGRQAALRALEISANLDVAIGLLMDVDLLAGRPAAALETCARYSDEDSRESARLWVLAMTPVEGGYEGPARVALEKYLALVGEAAGWDWSRAQVYAMRGELDLAFKWLERARSSRDQELMTIRIDPYLRNLHKDPRFAAFLKSINFPE